MNKNEFTELASNNYREALLALYEMIEQMRVDFRPSASREDLANTNNAVVMIRAEVDALQATVLELSTVVNAPAEE